MKGLSLGLERIDEMLQKLSDPDSQVRSTAAELLGCALPLSDSRVVPALINSLKDPSSDV